MLYACISSLKTAFFFSFQHLAVENLETAATYVLLHEFRGQFRYYPASKINMHANA